jgi:predicted nucleic acid-binding protein
VLNIIFEKIQIIPKEQYQDKLKQAQTKIEDVNDVSFVALSLALKTDGIWTNDKHFKTRRDLLIFRTKELALIFKSM